jgi:oligopeptide/dipeptide ABC transporter ATP-binding protein
VNSPLLRLRSLTTSLVVDGELRRVVEQVDLDVLPGEVVGLVGESGSGKSVTARSIIRLLPRGARCEGEIRFGERDVLQMSRAELRALRSEDVGMVFQDPRAHIDPLWTVGDYLGEGLRVHKRLRRAAVQQRSLELLADMGITDAERVLRSYPGELSGGMLQRVMIAGALSCEPRLLIADEATTALDVTVQSEILAIIRRLRSDQGLGILFITHDLGLASAICDRIVVMYAGRVVESQPAARLFSAPTHPYSAALVSARPSLEHPHDRLAAVPGRPVSALEAPAGCPFHPRCAYTLDSCRVERPTLVESAPGSMSACLRAEELRDVLHEGVHTRV